MHAIAHVHLKCFVESFSLSLSFSYSFVFSILSNEIESAPIQSETEKNVLTSYT